MLKRDFEEKKSQKTKEENDQIGSEKEEVEKSNKSPEPKRVLVQIKKKESPVPKRKIVTGIKKKTTTLSSNSRSRGELESW